MSYLYTTAEEAQKQVQKCVNKGFVQFGVFGSEIDVDRSVVLRGAYVTIVNFSETGVGDSTQCWGNLKLEMHYIDATFGVKSKPYSEEKVKSLILLCPKGDVQLDGMDELWGGKGKPHTVAIDENNGDIYLVYLNDWGMYLQMFERLTEVQKDLVLSEVDEENPFEFGVHKEALYKFIAREEGWRYMRESLYIQFNTINPLTVNWGRED